MSYQSPPPPPGGGYGQPAYGGAPQRAPMSVLSIISLVTGILGCCCPIFSIAAIVLGVLGRKETENGAKRGGGMATAGLVLGIVFIAINIVYWILVGADVIDSNIYADFDN